MFILTVETVECFNILVVLIYSFIFFKSHLPTHIQCFDNIFTIYLFENDPNEITPQHIRHNANTNVIETLANKIGKPNDELIIKNHFRRKNSRFYSHL